MATKPRPNARLVEWTPRVRLAAGQVGSYLGKCPITGKHRVTTYKDNRGRYLESIEGMESNEYVYTTWLLDDYGRCRGDLAPCDNDYAGEA